MHSATQVKFVIAHNIISRKSFILLCGINITVQEVLIASRLFLTDTLRVPISHLRGCKATKKQGTKYKTLVFLIQCFVD